MKHLITITLLLFSFTLFAQNKIYLDENWKETTQDKAHFYRILEKKSDSLYNVEDYYISGKMQMKGHFSDLEKETFEGEMSWYDKNGNITVKKNYIHGNENGLSIGYLPNGEILSQGTYKNGKEIDGVFIDECGCSLSAFENGVHTKDVYFYSNSKQPAKELYYSIKNEDEYPTKAVFYDRENKQIGILNYSETDHFTEESGTDYSFYRENNRCISIEEKREIKDRKTTQEIHYAKTGEILYQGTYKDGKPFDGYFFDNHIMTAMENGEIIAEVAVDKDLNTTYELSYKNGKPFEGTKQEYRKLKTYKNGKLVETKLFYDYDLKGVKTITTYANKTSKSISYDKKGVKIAELFIDENGKKNGLEIDGKTRNFYKNDTIIWVEKKDFTTDYKMLHCDYKDGKPFNGVKLDYQDKLFYKNGELIKRVYCRLNYDTEKYYITKIETLKDDQIQTRTTYKNGKEYTITFKEYSPYNGVFYDSYNNEISTYRDGKKEGLYTRYNNNEITKDASKDKSDELIEQGQYKNDKKEGEIIYFPNNPNKKTTCIFKNDLPINGIVSNNDNEVIRYKNGLKNGDCTERNEGYLTTSTYVNGKKEGKSTTIIDGKTYTGIYKNDKEYSGSFWVNNAIEHYKNGKKEGEFTTALNYLILQKLTYKAGKIIAEKTFLFNNKPFEEGLYKKNKPYNGTFINYDKSLRNDQIISYKKGKIVSQKIVVFNEDATYATTDTSDNAKESYYTVLESYSYKNGKKEGTYYNKNKDKLLNDKTEITGIYKKGRPYSGEFSTSQKYGLKILSTYKNGLKNGLEYYETSYGVKDSLNYSNGKITNGVQLELLEGSYGGYYFKHYYKDGIKEKTLVNMDTKITYQKDGFTLIYEDGKVLVNTKEKNIMYYNIKNEKIGVLNYEDGKLISGKVTFTIPKSDKLEQISTEVKNNRLITKMLPNKKFKMYFKMVENTTIPKNLSYKDFLLLKRAFVYSNDTEMQQYLLDDTLLANATMNTKDLTGTLVTFKETDNKILYKIEYKKDKKTQMFRNLTFEEMLEKVAELNKK